MSEAGQIQIFVTFFAALIIQNNLLGVSANDSIGVLLIFVNIGVLVLSVYFEVRSIREGRNNKAEDETAEKREFNSDGKSDIVQEHRKDALNPMVKLQESGIELAEIISRKKELVVKNFDKDNNSKNEDKKPEVFNSSKKNQESSDSIPESSVISYHRSQSKDLIRDIENGTRETQDFDSLETSTLTVGGDIVKRVQQNMRVHAADSDDEF